MSLRGVYGELTKMPDLLFRLGIISNIVLFSPLCYMLVGVCFAHHMTAKLKAFKEMFDINLESCFTLGRKNSFILLVVVTSTKIRDAVHRIYSILWYYKAEISPDSAASAICPVVQGKDEKPSLSPSLPGSTRVANREIVPLFNIALWVFSKTGKSMSVYQHGVEHLQDTLQFINAVCCLRLEIQIPFPVYFKSNVRFSVFYQIQFYYGGSQKLIFCICYKVI